MQISRKALCFFSIAILPVFYILFTFFINPVIATQSINLLLEKKFDNSMFILPADHFKIERKFRNKFLVSHNISGVDNIEGSFQNSNILIADKVLSAPPDYLSVNSNIYAQGIAGDLTASSPAQGTDGKNTADSDLSSLILIDDKFESFSNLTANKLYVGKIQSETYVPAYLRGVDFANYASLHLERAGDEEENQFNGSYNFDGEMAYGLTTLLNVNFDNPSITESETSLDMSELDQSADKLPTKDIFKRFSSFEDLNIVSANELEPFELDCSFLPEKSGPKDFNKFHVVEAKDSVISIAKEYNVTVSELMAANNLSSTSLSQGSTLLVPEKQNKENETVLVLADKPVKGSSNNSNDEKSSNKDIKIKVENMTAGVAESSKRMLWPSSSRRITSRYGVRVHPIYRVKKFHNGIDIGAGYGSTIKASSAGTVVYSGWKSFYGRTVIIKHSNDLYTLYAHCSKLTVKKGERVSRGTQIAKVGSSGLSTGPHIHFSVQKGGRFVNPMKYF